jgi:murein DD-endopeptidase MepM/ murein hydrolase activator NlpD
MKLSSPLHCVLALLLAGKVFAAAGERVEIAWPTPNTAWAEGKSLGAYLQDAGSGDPESGAFGGVRTGGSQFHEGIDIKAVARDRHGEPIDPVFAAMRGVVRHVSSSAGDSSYGRYIVLEHPEMVPAVYTLYAHLSRIAPELREGATVTRGQIIGTMGHSSGGYSIPRERAHLHFEIGVKITQNFQGWYDRRKFGSKNDHGTWNGMNLMGIDPLDFLAAWRAGRVDSFQDYFQRLPAAVTLRIATHQTPDFVTRYPSLLTKPLPLGPVSGWEIRCSWTGLPFSWTPLTSLDVVGLPAEQPRITAVDTELVRRQRSKALVVTKRGNWAVGKDLETVLQQLFGLR